MRQDASLPKRLGLAASALIPAGVACGNWDGRRDRYIFSSYTGRTAQVAARQPRDHRVTPGIAERIAQHGANGAGYRLPRPALRVWIVAVTLVPMATLHAFLKYKKVGLAVRAVAHNKDIAYLMGINVPLMISLLFGIGCAMGAAAGVLIGPINYVQVSMGVGILIKAFATAMVGGFGNLPGAVLGGLMGGGVESLGAGYLWQLQGHLRFYLADRHADGAAIRTSRNHCQDQSVSVGRSRPQRQVRRSSS
jgi:branched-subunit amino acid ABC-type transport system permease component